MPTPIGISGSRAAAVLGLSQYQTPVQVWLQIMEARQPGFCAERGYVLPVVEYSAPMRWGHAAESSLIEITEEKYQAKISDRERLLEMDYLSCHIDGRLGDDTLYEGKTASAFAFADSWGEDGSDRIPISYMLQVQHNLLLAHLKKAVVAVLVWPVRPETWEEMGIIPEKDGFGQWVINGQGFTVDMTGWTYPLAEMGFFHTYEIPANPQLQALMIEKYRAFWENHVLAGTPPEPMNVDDIRALVREPSGTIIADDRIERLMMEYKQIGAEIGTGGALAKRRDEIKTAVLSWMRDAEKTMDDDSEKKWIVRDRAGRKLATWGSDKNGRMGFR